MTTALSNRYRVTPLILALPILSISNVIAATSRHDSESARNITLWWNDDLNTPPSAETPPYTPIGENDLLTNKLNLIGGTLYLFHSPTLTSLPSIMQHWSGEEDEIPQIDLEDPHSLSRIPQHTPPASLWPAGTTPITIPPHTPNQLVCQLDVPESILASTVAPQADSTQADTPNKTKATTRSIFYEPAFSGILGLCGIGFTSYLLLKTGRRPNKK